jgi:class 3 adenylate cyclase
MRASRARALERVLAPLDAFSPAARLQPDGPGARALLADTELAAERAVHVARGVLLATVLTVFVIQLPNAPAAFGAVAIGAFITVPVFWVLVWRALVRPRPPGWLPYVLVLFDAWLGVRGAVLVQTPLYGALRAEQYLTPTDLAILAGPILAFVAASGGFRLRPRMALYSTAVAVLSYAYVAWALDVSRNAALLAGAVIAFLGLLSVQVARVFRHTMLRAREEAILERYVPAALVRELVRTGDPLGEGREVDITVILVDIRGYTGRAERLTPRQAVAFLNGYFAVVVAPLAAEGAVLDKYLGDGVLAFFEGEEHARRAMRAARAILNAIDAYNGTRPPADAVTIGIAVHAGPALVGTIGAEQKREYTAIADAVNLTARLEELNKTFGSSLVVSEAVLASLPSEERTGIVGPINTPIRGREASLNVGYLVHDREAVGGGTTCS